MAEDRLMSTPKFEIHNSRNSEFYFVLKADNGKVIGTSETYTVKDNAKNGISSVKSNARVKSNFTIFTGRDNQYYFNLKATNGQIILGSEGYRSRAGAENGVDSVHKNAPIAIVVDLTT